MIEKIFGTIIILGFGVTVFTFLVIFAVSIIKDCRKEIEWQEWKEKQIIG